MGTLSALDREIASHWVAEVGQEALFARVQAETAWAGPVTIQDADDGVIVHCDLGTLPALYRKIRTTRL